MESRLQRLKRFKLLTPGSMSYSFQIAAWNTNGLPQRRLELENFLHTENINVILVLETHFTNQTVFKIKGYLLYSTETLLIRLAAVPQ